MISEIYLKNNPLVAFLLGLLLIERDKISSRKHTATWYSKNKEKKKEYIKQWRKDNPDKVDIIEKRYKAKINKFA